MNDRRSVSHLEAEAQAKEKGLIFEEVSAKSGLNINKLFYKDIFELIARKFNLGGMGEFENNDTAKDSQRSKLVIYSVIFSIDIFYFYFIIFLDNNIVLEQGGDSKETKPKKKKCC